MAIFAPPGCIIACTVALTQVVGAAGIYGRARGSGAAMGYGSRHLCSAALLVVFDSLGLCLYTNLMYLAYLLLCAIKSLTPVR